MKKFCITFLLSAIICVMALCCPPQKVASEDFFRLHIRANSNLYEEQMVKYLVKDKVVEYLLPVVATAKSKKESVACIKRELRNIEKVANAVLLKNGFTYTAKADIKREYFPLRYYGDVGLESGYYDALIILLGEGVGENWWCVLYPPLCFTKEGENTVYASFIAERIKEWFSGK